MYYTYRSWLYTPEVNCMIMQFPLFTDLFVYLMIYSLSVWNLQQISILFLYNKFISKYTINFNKVDLLLVLILTNFYYEQNNFEFVIYLLSFACSLIKKKMSFNFIGFALFQFMTVVLTIFTDNWLFLGSEIAIYICTTYLLERLPILYNFVFDRENKVEQALIKNLFSAVLKLSIRDGVTAIILFIDRDETNCYIEEDVLFKTFDSKCQIAVQRLALCLLWKERKIFIGSHIVMTDKIISESEEDKCEACFEVGEKWKLTCGHSFCDACSVSWFCKVNTCPMCRQIVL